MNILFVSAILPYPLFSGGQVRIYNILRLLAKKHTITLLSFIRNEEERSYAKELDFLSSVTMIHRGYALHPRIVSCCESHIRTVLNTYNVFKLFFHHGFGSV